MKKLAIAVVLGILVVGLFNMPVLAADPDDPISVDVVVVGDDPTVTVEADGEDATIYINGQDIQQPTVKVKKYRVENPYDDAALKEAISNIEALLGETNSNLYVTSDGLSKVLLVIGEHTSNLRDLLDVVNQNAQDSVNRDNELVENEEVQDAVILQLSGDITAVSNSIDDMDETYQAAIANLHDDIDRLNTRNIWTWGSLGIIGLLLGGWKIWQIRLRRD